MIQNKGVNWWLVLGLVRYLYFLGNVRLALCICFCRAPHCYPNLDIKKVYASSPDQNGDKHFFFKLDTVTSIMLTHKHQVHICPSKLDLQKCISDVFWSVDAVEAVEQESRNLSGRPENKKNLYQVRKFQFLRTIRIPNLCMWGRENFKFTYSFWNYNSISFEQIKSFLV